MNPDSRGPRLTKRGSSVAVVAMVAWAAVVVWSVWPDDASSYAQVAVRSAQQTLSAAGSTLLIADADRSGRVIGTYAGVALDESRESAGTAAQEMLTAAVPDDASAELRMQVVPLLVAGSDGITAVQTALESGDADEIRVAVAALVPVRDALDEFVSEQQQ